MNLFDPNDHRLYLAAAERAFLDTVKTATERLSLVGPEEPTKLLI